MLSRLADDTNAVKLIFDHFRNVGLCAVVLGSAVWTYRHPPSERWVFMWVLSLFAMSLMGICLFLLNEFHAHRLLKKAGLPLLPELVIRLGYSACIFQVLVALMRVE